MIYFIGNNESVKNYTGPHLKAVQALIKRTYMLPDVKYVVSIDANFIRIFELIEVSVQWIGDDDD